MAMENLGRVAYVDKGAYSENAVYQKKDVVQYQNGSYVLTAESASGILPTDTAYWTAMLNPTLMNTATDGANAAATSANAAATSANAAATSANAAATSANAAAASIQSDLAQKAPAIFLGASGDLVHITDGADMPVKSLITHIAPVQEGEGDPSPVNARAISGWDQASVTNDASGQTLTAELPETVYGGEYDWTTGMLTVDRACKVFDGTEAFTMSVNTSDGFAAEGRNGFWISIGGGALMGTATDTPICNYFHGIKRSNLKNNTKNNVVTIGGGGREIDFCKTDYTTLEDWKAYVAAQYAAGTPVTVVYALNTTYTIQLTPQQLSTLKGTNNIWSNAGATEVTYAADTQLYADGKDSNTMIAPVEHGMIASQNYNIGDLLVAQNTLYRSTVAIATGETIVPGSNCEETTVSENLGGGGGSGGNYVLPIASADTLGGVKVGEGLQMDGDVLGVKPEGEWELIETIVPDDDIIISRTQKPDGTAYNLKKVLVILSMSADLDASNSMNLQFSTVEITANAWFNGVQTNGKIRHGTAKCETIGELTEITVTPYTNTGAGGDVTRYYPSLGGKPIVKIKTTAAIKRGQEVQIWGVQT